MKQYIFVFLIWILLLQSTAGLGQNHINSKTINESIAFLASDEMEGRATPSKGLELSAAYISSFFKDIGLKNVNDDYRHSLRLQKKKLDNNNRFYITKDGNKKDFALKTDFIPFAMSNDTLVNASMVFVGYGISAPEFMYDDYEGIDVKGKIVVMLTGFVAEKDTGIICNNKPLRKLSGISTKVNTAIEKGAIAVIVFTGPANNLLLKPRGYPWPSLSKIIPDSFTQVIKGETGKKVPAIHAGTAVMDYIFGSVEALKQIQKDIDKSCTPASFAIQQCQAEIKTNVIEQVVSADNIVGYIEGSDSLLKKEFIVFGAHYDHVGIKGKVDEGEDGIYNGADDNASGTAAVMAIAQAYQQNNIKPSRSVVFILFAGEEIGLMGSDAYVEKPLFPLAQTKLMLNLDMIGYGAHDSLWIDGAYKYPELEDVIVKNNRNINLKLITEKTRMSGGSDHMSFQKKNVTAVHFFTGLHQHYHQVSDELPIIDISKATRVAELAYLTSLYYANQNN